ncbi:hypothetical protein CAPTEDRAFT_197712 [Capitella teleta]|uniref:C-type lectin domain-containing protein n=1 Tax=Capitella teleta TaxID=283909 RepID=R7U7E0_CAPTE|nr:hypothetical protein CAPTEDRAFT_197712 [Capitella teleta]|eukprot:ELT99055.1 hypothetical protein CAPTEDRAFT_197712 [Capitella teleta]
MDYCFWMKTRQIVLLCSIICVIWSGSCFALEHTLSIARKYCKHQSSHLPLLSSVRDGSLESQLELGQSTWVDAWIERGPWMWHSSDKELHSNQGCFRTNITSSLTSFLGIFRLGSYDLDQKECMTYCSDNHHLFSGMSMQGGTRLCYCGNEVPQQGAVGDSQYGECLNLNISKAVANDIPWVNGYRNYTSSWCAALQYKEKKAVLSQSDCHIGKRALCIRDSGGAYNVSRHPMSWFEAQNFCYEVQTHHSTNTFTLSEVMTNNLLDAGVTATENGYWTQLSRLRLDSEYFPGVIVGAGVGGIMAVLTLVVGVLVLLFFRKKKRSTGSPTQSMAYVNDEKVAKTKDHVYTVKGTRGSNNESEANQEENTLVIDNDLYGS